MIPQLRPYQLDLFERVKTARAAGSRIIVVQAATGAGKTKWAGHVTKQCVAKGSRVLFLVHLRKLVDQISSTLIDFEVNHGTIMRGEDPFSAAPVQVASRDTLLSRCVNNEWQPLPPADLVVVDEAHHAANPQSEYRRILANYPRATMLLLTATPEGPGGQGLGPWAQAIECAAPTSQLVRDGYLLPVKCFAPDRKLHRGKVKRGIAGDLVGSWQQYAENQPTVLFCSRVQHSLDAVAAFQAAGVPAVHVDADTPDHVREAAFEGLGTGVVRVVSNVGIIGEGVDIPVLGCCQVYCEMGGRVRWLQACGRVMRPHQGQAYGIVIDHAGAVFRHGFPDEDSEWTLEGNADEAFAKKKEEGKTEQVHYCKHCELLFKGTLGCPQCHRQPVKPPRSIFAAPPVDASNELLVEADRKAGTGIFSKEQKVKHWLRCLGVAAQRNGTFGQAGAIYRQKYDEFPGDDFPCVPDRSGWKTKVVDVHPQFKRSKKKEPAA